MKPLSGKKLREKIEDLVYDAVEHGEELHTGRVKTREEIEEEFGKLLSTVDSITGLILQDRKAWGEYVIGEDEPEPEIPVNDYYWRFRNELRARQRQRNQGEKTDENS